MECDELWKDAKSNIGKKTSFSELLKLLENSGLHKHKFEIMKVSNNSKWFSEPSYNSEHLLLTQSRLSFKDSDTSTVCDHQWLPNENLDREWKTANQFYFQSLASVQHLLQVCLRPHEDITYEQASRSVSFVSHLIIVQQKQRTAAYAFAKKLNCLRAYVSALEMSYTKCSGTDQINKNECSIAQNKSDLFKCLWKQKLLFDVLTAMLVEALLLLKTVESTHPKSCQIVKPTANHAVQFIENKLQIMQRSKESLDSYFLRQVGSKHAIPFYPYVIPKQMKELVRENFQVIREFEEDLCKQDFNRSLVMKTIFSHFDDTFKKVLPYV
uniref:Midasin-related family protein n=1 Tax=Rhizophora mucronata TaxID=61149 RepID=A0A2P2MUQ4_RHIMU